MKKLLNNLLASARHYGVFDFAIFKVTLLLMGVLLGVIFYEFFFYYRFVVLVVAALGLGYMCFTTIRYFPKK